MPQSIFDTTLVVERSHGWLRAFPLRTRIRSKGKLAGALPPIWRKLNGIFALIFAERFLFDKTSGFDACMNISAASRLTLVAIGSQGVKDYFAVQRSILRNVASAPVATQFGGLSTFCLLSSTALSIWKRTQRFPPTACSDTRLVADGILFISISLSPAPVCEAMEEFKKNLRRKYQNPQRLDSVVAHVLSQI